MYYILASTPFQWQKALIDVTKLMKSIIGKESGAKSILKKYILNMLDWLSHPFEETGQFLPELNTEWTLTVNNASSEWRCHQTDANVWSAPASVMGEFAFPNCIFTPTV